MRLLHTSDWHLGKNIEGISRLDEQEKFLNDFVNIVKENNIDLVVIAGDIYDSSNPPARAEKLFYDTLKKISNNGEVITLIISGNHDNPDRLVSVGPLAREHGIIMVGTPKSIIEIEDYGKHKVINSGEGFIELQINDEKAVILTVPYPSEKRLNEVLYNCMDSEEDNAKSYSDRIFSLFENLKVNFRKDTINLVVSHLFAMGSEETGSERAIQLGGSYIVEGNCFPDEAQYIALGHIHKPQIVPNSNKKARYSGSPLHYNKKEISFNKKCFIVDLKSSEEAKISEVILDVYKPIEIWKCTSIEEALTKCEENKDKESWVYIEIETDRYIGESEIKMMKDIKSDILEITPKININNEQFNEDIDILEESFEDIFKEFYLKERNLEPSSELIEMFLKITLEEGENSETN